MRRKKKIWVPIICLILVAAMAAGLVVYLRSRPAAPVSVYSISDNYLYTYYWGNESSSDGIVTADKLQTVYLSVTQEVTEVNVYVGQQVHAGDPLLTYDTTLNQLSLDRQKLDIEKRKIQLEDAKAQLAEINKMVPISYTTVPAGTTAKPTTPPATNRPTQELPSSGYLVYGSHSGTINDPLRVWIRDTLKLGQANLADIVTRYGSGNPTYVVFETRQNNQRTGDVKSCMGVAIAKEEISEPAPEGPSEFNPQGPQPDVPTTEATEPVTDPTETIPSTEETTEPVTEETEPAADSSTAAGESAATGAEQASPVSVRDGIDRSELVFLATGSSTTSYYVIVSVFAASPLDSTTPTTKPPATGGTQINMNSGYTANEIAQMRADKQAEIKELEFNIKMAEAEYKIMEKEFDNGVVTSELDGYVVSVLTAEEAMNSNEPIVKVSGGGGYTIQGSISELKLDTIHVGDPVQVYSWMTGISCEGVISAIGEYPAQNQYGYYGDGNPNVSFYPFTVTISGDENLQAGDYAQITYASDSADTTETIYLDCSFLRSENGVYYAYVENKEGLLEKRRIQVGAVIYSGSYIEIRNGLTLEDYIAFPYGKSLKEGAPVIRETDMSSLYGGY